MFFIVFFIINFRFWENISSPQDYYIIDRSSDSGMLLERIDALTTNQRAHLLGYLAALEENK